MSRNPDNALPPDDRPPQEPDSPPEERSPKLPDRPGSLPRYLSASPPVDGPGSLPRYLRGTVTGASPDQPSRYTSRIQSQPRTSGWATAGFTLSLVGLCCAIGSILGLIFSLMGIQEINRNRGMVSGRGIAMAGVIISSVLLALNVMMIAGVFSGIINPNAFTASSPLDKLRELSTAALACAAGHSNRLPPPQTWPDVLLDGQYVSGKEIFLDPTAPEAGRAYAMNLKLAGVDTSQVAQREQTVLFFECAPGGPFSGGREHLPATPRHPEGYLIGFLNGDARFVPPDQIGAIIWDPATVPAKMAPDPSGTRMLELPPDFKPKRTPSGTSEDVEAAKSSNMDSKWRSS